MDKNIKMGESDCGFFVFKSKIVKEKLKFLIKKKLILTKKTKEMKRNFTKSCLKIPSSK